MAAISFQFSISISISIYFSYFSDEITNEIILVSGITKYTLYEYNREFGLYIIQTLNININGHNNYTSVYT